MTHGAEFGLTVATGLVAVLIVATIVGRSLELLVARGRPHAVLDNVNQRIATWWLIALLFGAAAGLGVPGLALLFAVLSLQALKEYLPPTQSLSTSVWIALLALTIAQYALAVFGPSVAFALFVPACALAAIVMGAVAKPSTASWRAIPAAALLCIYALAHVPAIAALDVPNAAHLRVGPAVFLVIVTQASDVLQFIAGKLAGRRRLAPTLSPGKTVEGALGGILGAAALGALLAPLTPYAPMTAALVAGLLVVLGIAGGLVLSGEKRRRGIKDWSAVIPGHGGVLDRVDSLCLSAPAFYYVLACVGPR